MKTDMYTKVVLTVIALALTINLIKDFSLVPSAQASPAPIPEPAMVQQSGVVDVNIVQVNGHKLSPMGAPDCLPVYNWGK